MVRLPWQRLMPPVDAQSGLIKRLGRLSIYIAVAKLYDIHITL